MKILGLKNSSIGKRKHFVPNQSVSFGANLTPDQSGIGNWTEEQFKRALMQGKFKGIEGTRTLLPRCPGLTLPT